MVRELADGRGLVKVNPTTRAILNGTEDQPTVGAAGLLGTQSGERVAILAMETPVPAEWAFAEMGLRLLGSKDRLAPIDPHSFGLQGENLADLALRNPG